MKKEAVCILIIFILAFSITFVSAGWWGDFWDKITGKVITSDWCEGADINRDGVVDDSDQQIIWDFATPVTICDDLNDSETRDLCYSADLNNNGQVDPADDVIHDANYGRTDCGEDEITETIACYTGYDCGETEWDAHCDGDDSWCIDYVIPVCENPGTNNSYCTETERTECSSCHSDKICQAGECVEESSNETNQTTCTDSDHGENYLVKGTISYTNGSFSFNDSCSNWQILMEYYCTSWDAIMSRFANCTSTYGEGYVCDNGACLYENLTIVCYNNSNCGGMVPIGDSFCSGNQSCTNYENNTCVYPGATSSYCTNSTDVLCMDCTSGCNYNTGECITGELTCEDCGFLGMGCSYDDCHNLGNCYYNPQFWPWLPDCVGIGDACQEINNCTVVNEYECDNDVCSLNCEFVDGQCVEEEFSCIDSDGGNNMSVFGFVNSSIGYSEDVCVENYVGNITDLVEYYCEENYVGNQTYKCDDCEEGICSCSYARQTCYDVDTVGYKNVDCSWENTTDCEENEFCDYGRCRFCLDSDGGIFPFVFGNVTTDYSVYLDECTNSTRLRERYCAEPGYSNNAYYECNNCENGICDSCIEKWLCLNYTTKAYRYSDCVDRNLTYCEYGCDYGYAECKFCNDSDGGIDYSVKGNITYGVFGKYQNSYSEYCYNNDQSLREYYCAGGGQVFGYDSSQCNCSDGACIA